MKLLTVMRHSKSEWGDVNTNDHDRDLNHRGLRDREIMASIMEKNEIRPQYIICSTALRARKTIASVAKDEWIQPRNMDFRKELYLASEEALCTQISLVDDSIEHLMVCAHNPGLTDFVNQHTDLMIDNLPTSGLVSAQFDIESWSQIFSSTGTMQYHLWPKLFV